MSSVPVNHPDTFTPLVGQHLQDPDLSSRPALELPAQQVEGMETIEEEGGIVTPGVIVAYSDSVNFHSSPRPPVGQRKRVESQSPLAFRRAGGEVVVHTTPQSLTSPGQQENEISPESQASQTGSTRSQKQVHFKQHIDPTRPLPPSRAVNVSQALVFSGSSARTKDMARDVSYRYESKGHGSNHPMRKVTQKPSPPQPAFTSRHLVEKMVTKSLSRMPKSASIECQTDMTFGPEDVPLSVADGDEKQQRHYETLFITQMLNKGSDNRYEHTSVPDAYHEIASAPFRHLLDEFEDAEITYNEEQKLWNATLFPSKVPSGRMQAIYLSRCLAAMLKKRHEQQPVRVVAPKFDSKQPLQGREYAMEFDVREYCISEMKLWDIVLGELCRQVHVHCAERGVLLDRIRARFRECITSFERPVKSLQEFLRDAIERCDYKEDQLQKVTKELEELPELLRQHHEAQTKGLHEQIKDMSEKIAAEKKARWKVQEDYWELEKRHRCLIDLVKESSVGDNELQGFDESQLDAFLDELIGQKKVTGEIDPDLAMKSVVAKTDSGVFGKSTMDDMLNEMTTMEEEVAATTKKNAEQIQKKLPRLQSLVKRVQAQLKVDPSLFNEAEEPPSDDSDDEDEQKELASSKQSVQVTVAPPPGEGDNGQDSENAENQDPNGVIEVDELDVGHQALSKLTKANISLVSFGDWLGEIYDLIGRLEVESGLANPDDVIDLEAKTMREITVEMAELLNSAQARLQAAVQLEEVERKRASLQYGEGLTTIAPAVKKKRRSRRKRRQQQAEVQEDLNDHTIKNIRDASVLGDDPLNNSSGLPKPADPIENSKSFVIDGDEPSAMDQLQALMEEGQSDSDSDKPSQGEEEMNPDFNTGGNAPVILMDQGTSASSAIQERLERQKKMNEFSRFQHSADDEDPWVELALLTKIVSDPDVDGAKDDRLLELVPADDTAPNVAPIHHEASVAELIGADVEALRREQSRARGFDSEGEPHEGMKLEIKQLSNIFGKKLGEMKDYNKTFNDYRDHIRAKKFGQEGVKDAEEMYLDVGVQVGQAPDSNVMIQVDLGPGLTSISSLYEPANSRIDYPMVTAQLERLTKRRYDEIGIRDRLFHELSMLEVPEEYSALPSVLQEAIDMDKEIEALLSDDETMLLPALEIDYKDLDTGANDAWTDNDHIQRHLQRESVQKRAGVGLSVDTGDAGSDDPTVLASGYTKSTKKSSRRHKRNKNGLGGVHGTESPPESPRKPVSLVLTPAPPDPTSATTDATHHGSHAQGDGDPGGPLFHGGGGSGPDLSSEAQRGLIGADRERRRRRSSSHSRRSSRSSVSSLEGSRSRSVSPRALSPSSAADFLSSQLTGGRAPSHRGRVSRAPSHTSVARSVSSQEPLEGVYARLTRAYKPKGSFRPRNERLMEIVNGTRTKKTKPKSKTWLLRLVRDTYKEKIHNDLQRDREGNPHVSLPDFLFEYLKQVYGTRSLVDSNVSAVVATMMANRRDDLYVDAFALMLEEEWSSAQCDMYLKGLTMCDELAVGLTYPVPSGDVLRPRFVDLDRAQRVVELLMQNLNTTAATKLSVQLERLSEPLNEADLKRMAQMLRMNRNRSNLEAIQEENHRKLLRNTFLYHLCQLGSQYESGYQDFISQVFQNSKYHTQDGFISRVDFEHLVRDNFGPDAMSMVDELWAHALSSSLNPAGGKVDMSGFTRIALQNNHCRAHFMSVYIPPEKKDVRELNHAMDAHQQTLQHVNRHWITFHPIYESIVGVLRSFSVGNASANLHKLGQRLTSILKHPEDAESSEPAIRLYRKLVATAGQKLLDVQASFKVRMNAPDTVDLRSLDVDLQALAQSVMPVYEYVSQRAPSQGEAVTRQLAADSMASIMGALGMPGGNGGGGGGGGHRPPVPGATNAPTTARTVREEAMTRAPRRQGILPQAPPAGAPHGPPGSHSTAGTGGSGNMTSAHPANQEGGPPRGRRVGTIDAETANAAMHAAAAAAAAHNLGGGASVSSGDSDPPMRRERSLNSMGRGGAYAASTGALQERHRQDNASTHSLREQGRERSRPGLIGREVSDLVSRQGPSQRAVEHHAPPATWTHAAAPFNSRHRAFGSTSSPAFKTTGPSGGIARSSSSSVPTEPATDNGMLKISKVASAIRR